ncbi:hypothetical protein CR513_27815, partial [Mucuna pruriens]
MDTRGYINLLTTSSESSAFHTISIRYLIVEADISYNVLIAQLTLNALNAIVSEKCAFNHMETYLYL